MGKLILLSLGRCTIEQKDEITMSFHTPTEKVSANASSTLQAPNSETSSQLHNCKVPVKFEKTSKKGVTPHTSLVAYYVK